MGVWESSPSAVMADKKEEVRQLCADAIERVDRAIDNHRKGEPEDLSITILAKVRLELVKMREALSPVIFQPSFGRFVLDWPDRHGLIQQLTQVSYEYGRLR